MKHRNKRYDDDTELSMEYALKALLDFVMPEIAISMVEKNYFFITEEDIYDVIEEYFIWLEGLKRPQEWMHWYYGYASDIRVIFREIKRIDSGRRIPAYACNVLGIMRSTANRTYFFTHQYFRDYFAACALINRMLTAIEYDRYRINGWNAGLKAFSEMVYPLHEQEVSDYVCALVGEILGERKNIPIYNSMQRRWNIRTDRTIEQNILMDFMNFYRDIGKNSDENIGAQTGLKNIFSILKKSRIQNDGNIDFSGIDFRNLDVSHLSLSGIIFSHFGRDGTVYKANLQGTRGLLEALQQDDKQQTAACCGMHPKKRKILILNESSSLLMELDLDSGERTVLFRTTPGHVSAFYIGKYDNILAIRSKQEPKDYNDEYEERGIFKRIFHALYEEDNEEEEYKEEEYEEEEDLELKQVNNAEIELSCYFRKRNQMLYCGIDALAYLGCLYSEEYGQMSLFMKSEEGIVLLILDVEESHLEDKLAIVETGRFIVPIEKKYWKYINSDTFMFTRLDEDNYLLSDCRLWKWNIGQWNIKSGEIKSICYIDDHELEGGFKAACRKPDRKNTYFLIETGKMYVMKQEQTRYMDSFSGWSMSAGEKDKLLMLNERALLLTLTDGILLAYDMEEEKVLWSCEQLNILQIFIEHGTLVANADNGIYEIDLVDGGYRCLHQFHQGRTDFMIGRTSNMTDVILYESTGVVKWLKVKNGCCFRQLSVQKADAMIDDLFYDESRGKLYGVSGDKIYRWNGWSGVLEEKITLPYSDEWTLVFSEFYPPAKILEVYFERKEYRKFPLQKRYFVMKWSLENENWKYRHNEKNDKKKLFRYVYTEEGEAFAMECMDNGEDIPGVPLYNNRDNFLYEDEFDFEDDIWEDETLRYRERMIWDTKHSFRDVCRKDIYYYGGSGKWMRFDNISGGKQIIGIAGNGILYAINKGDADADMKLFRPGQEEFVKFGGSYGQKFTAALVIANTFVGLAYETSSGMITNRSRVFFWNTEGETLYEYEINDKIYAVGCDVASESARNKSEKKMMQMEGMITPSIHRVRRVERFENKSLFKPVGRKKLLKQWNYPALFCVVLLTIFSVLLQMEPIAKLYSVGNDGSAYVKNCIKYIVISGIMIWGFKVFYPRLICVMQQEKIYSKKMSRFLVVTILGSCLIKVMSAPYFKYDVSFHYSTVIGTFLILPFVLAYFYECPTGDEELILVEIAFCGGWLWLILTDNDLSIVIKIELILFMVFSILYVLGKCRFRIDGKAALKKIVMYVGGAGVLAVTAAYFTLLKENASWDVIGYIMQRHASWSRYYQHVRKTIYEYQFWGPADNLDQCQEKDFVYNFSLNYAMEHYGWICGVVIISLVLMMLYFMWKGARQQAILVDRCICMSCTIYFLIETVIALLPVVGIGVIPPYRLPFWGGNVFMQRTTWMAFGIYMAFYHAHGRYIK